LLPNPWILNEGTPYCGRDPAFCPKGHLRLVLYCGAGLHSLIYAKRSGTSFSPNPATKTARSSTGERKSRGFIFLGKVMNNRRWLFFLIVIGLATLVFNTPALAFNDTQESRESLRDVTPIYVIIEGITPALEQNWISAHQLKKDVEIQFRKAGIQVIANLEKKESAKSFPAGLYARINTLKSCILKSEFNIDYYAISISVELIQRCLPLTHEVVSLVSEKNIDPHYISSHSALTCTWSTSNIYLAGEERIIDIRDCVKDLVGYFISAYLFVNPKRK
jgi:hypothetical protein